MPREIELLAPARNADIAIEAVRHGADAVYIGAPAFGARAAAGNSVDEIARAVGFAHSYGAAVYVTLNTILYDSELEDARRLVGELYRIGVDALIVQDMAYLEMDLPPIPLHASTQCDIREVAKARRLARAGFSQLVLPREFSVAEIKAVSEAVDVPLEVFVHGALCVSYSGDCQAGQLAMGRSANRGACPQMCRLPYDLLAPDGSVIESGRHFLSLRDLCRIDSLEELIAAGATSFKIEGRLKDASYVKNVVAAYSQALDAIVERSGGALVRRSQGRVTYSFTPDLNRTFNRGYTSYFFHGRPSNMASMATPKWVGAEVGRVIRPYDRCRGFFVADLSEELANGDGLSFFDRTGRFVGFRLNRADGSRLYPATPVDVASGTVIYRNSDRIFLDRLEASAAERRIGLKGVLRSVPDDRIVLELEDERGASVSVSAICPEQQSQRPQQEYRVSQLSKLGATVYTLDSLDDRIGDRFVPASVLSALRRDAVAAMDSCRAARLPYDRRRPDTLDDNAFAGESPLSYHDNVANVLAARFYHRHGATIGEQAVEVEDKAEGERVVMTTRYCLRRELGACLRSKNAGRLPSPLYLRSRDILYRLDFDCDRCGMKLVLNPVSR